VTRGAVDGLGLGATDVARGPGLPDELALRHEQRPESTEPLLQPVMRAGRRVRLPVGYRILIADGRHNFIGGLAVGSAFVVDIRLDLVTWLVAADHEVPQELGDFGILVHSRWSRALVLVYNGASALTFLVGGQPRTPSPVAWT
jgi:zinc transporter ZupT